METQIVIFGEYAKSSKEVFSALAQFQNWEVSAITNVESAIEKMHQQRINMIVFTDETQPIDESKLRKIGSILNSEIIFLHYTSHPSFKQKIVAMLNQQRLQKPTFAFMDRAFKKARINISLN